MHRLAWMALYWGLSWAVAFAPAELLIYTREEWNRLQREGGRFAAMLASEASWLFSRPASP